MPERGGHRTQTRADDQPHDDILAPSQNRFNGRCNQFLWPVNRQPTAMAYSEAFLWSQRANPTRVAWRLVGNPTALTGPMGEAVRRRPKRWPLTSGALNQKSSGLYCLCRTTSRSRLRSLPFVAASWSSAALTEWSHLPLSPTEKPKQCAQGCAYVLLSLYACRLFGSDSEKIDGDSGRHGR